MQWDDSLNGGFTTGNPFTDFVKGELDYHHLNVAQQLTDKNSLFHAVSKMINIRKQHHAFGRGNMEWILTDNPSITIYMRKYQGETLLIINNLSDSAQTISLPRDVQFIYADLLTNAQEQIGPTLKLQPYAYRWLKR